MGNPRLKKNLNNIKMRASNFFLVINAIREKGTISRSDIAPIVGLTPATITNLVNMGIEDGYIIRVGSGDSHGGRKPQLLELNSEVGYLVGIEINAKEAICILTDFTERIIAKKYIALHKDIEFEVLMDELADVVNGFLEERGLTKDDVFGVGFATVGPCDHINGRIVRTPNFPKWENVNVVEMFKKRTGIDGYLEKETAAFALNQSWNDKSNLYKRLLCVNVFGTGIGGGMTLDKQIYHGHHSAGLEIGHMTVLHNGPVCACGRRGCLEGMADGDAAVRHYHEYIKGGIETQISDTSDLDYKDIMAFAEKGDIACQKAIKKCAVFLGEAISSLIAILAPDVIYIGGEFIEQSDLLYAETVAKASERTYPFLESDIKILKSKDGRDSGALGAAAIVFKTIFSVG